MKVLYLTHQYFPRHVGGTEVYTRSLVRRLVREGHRALVVTYHEAASTHVDEFHVERVLYEDVPVFEMHGNLAVTAHPARCEYDNSYMARLLGEVLASERPDVVHAMHAMKLSGAALEACYRASVPVVVSLCDYWFLCARHTLLTCEGGECSGPDEPRKCVACVRDLHGFAAPPRSGSDWPRYAADLVAIDNRPLFLRRVLLSASRIIALSRFQKQVFVKNGFPAERIEVLQHGLEIEDLDPIPEEVAEERLQGPRRIGIVSSLVPHKGVHVVLEALARAPALDVECRIHGRLHVEDRYAERLNELASRDRRVRLMGGFEPAHMGKVLRSLDLLAVPAVWHENEPLVVKAALHLGLPVLASCIGSLEDMITPGLNGWLVPPGDADAWAAAFANWLQQPRQWFPPTPVKTMAENAREVFEIYKTVAEISSDLRQCA